MSRLPEEITSAGPEEQGPPEELLARARRAAANAVQAGQFAPTFRLTDVHGGHQALIDLIEHGPLVLSFYRGVWCDFCGAALDALASLDTTIRSLGAAHVAIGPPPGDEAQRAKLEAFPMPLLIDRGLKITASYGLAIALPDELHEHYARVGYVPTKAGEPGKWMIPVPATYIIDRLGKVVLAAIDIDYRNRLDPSELISALRGLGSRA